MFSTLFFARCETTVYFRTLYWQLRRCSRKGREHYHLQKGTYRNSDRRRPGRQSEAAARVP